MYDPMMWKKLLDEDDKSNLIALAAKHKGNGWEILLDETKNSFEVTVFYRICEDMFSEKFSVDKDSIRYVEDGLSFLNFVERILKIKNIRSASLWIRSLDVLLSENLKNGHEIKRAQEILERRDVVGVIETAIQFRLDDITLSDYGTKIPEVVLSCFFAELRSSRSPVRNNYELYDLASKGYLRFIKARLAEVLLYHHSKIVCQPEPRSSKRSYHLRYRYHSLDVTTYRSFVSKIDTFPSGNSGVNFQNIAKDSPVNSRFLCSDPRSYIYEFDFSTQEFTILKNLCDLKSEYDHDIHQRAADILKIERKWAKQVNYAMIYGAGMKTVNEIFEKYSVTQEDRKAYLSYIYPAYKAITDYVEKAKKDYVNKSFTYNPYGRVIELEEDEKSRANRNRIIQSISSEILVDTLLAIMEYLKDKKSRILFHRWDSVFVDIYSEEEDEVVNKICDIMKNQSNGMIFNIDTKRGKSLGSLEPVCRYYVK